MNKAYLLLTLLQAYAPNSTTAAHITRIYNEMQLDGVTGVKLEIALVGMLHNGLNYGNWPWIVFNTANYSLDIIDAAIKE